MCMLTLKHVKYVKILINKIINPSTLEVMHLNIKDIEIKEIWKENKIQVLQWRMWCIYWSFIR